MRNTKQRDAVTDVLDAFRQLARYAVEEGCSAALLSRIVYEEYEPVRATPCFWSREQAVTALVAFTERERRLPVVREARAVNGLPSGGCVRRLFGSWTAFLSEAGFYDKREAA